MNIHLNLKTGDLITGYRLEIAKNKINLDAEKFSLPEVDYVMLPKAEGLELSMETLRLKHTYLDRKIIIELKSGAHFKLVASIVSFYKELVFIVGGTDGDNLVTMVPVSSIKSYKLKNLAGIDDNYAEKILHTAIERKASDIHLKPRKDHTVIQLRLDGVLTTFKKIPTRQHLKIISKFKIMAGMDIAERRLAQDGSASIRYKGREIDLRLSTAPTIEGESMVLRILDPDSNLRTLSDIGFETEDEARIRQVLKKRGGLVLVTGPTGSGKSTTLYAAMDLIREFDLNTISIEDPVEYRIDDIKQIEVNETIGSSFASILRHVLRHDPDIIIIGEIRDAKTAKIAIQSALTGHLVISTMHTQDAVHAISRLMEIGIEPYLIQDTLQAVLAQRLVRKLCHKCKDSGKCDVCNNTGFKGRTILYEWLEIDKALRPLINNKFNLSKFKQKALLSGMRDFSKNAGKLIDARLTTADEVFVVE